MTNRQLFFRHLAQTSPAPPAIEITHGKGIYLYGPGGKKYIDLISGISVSSLGHAHPKINAANKKQMNRHSYVMVYGEYIVAPQVAYAKLLVKHLPKQLDNVFFVNSGSEAVEGALKLAKRYTGRTEIIAFKKAYHGSTHGALSVLGDEGMKQAYRPLLPDVRHIEFNNENDLEKITTRTACVIAEPVQAEAGVMAPQNNFLAKLKKRCVETGALLIMDEIQTGMGRTGPLFAFERYKTVPDILCAAKAFGGGMPLGAFISSKKIMSSLSHDPALGHITTFGGHPLSCVAGMEALKLARGRSKGTKAKGELLKRLLVHPRIKEVRGEGLLLAVQFSGAEQTLKIISRCAENGVITDWFLFNPSAMRIAPPLIITEKEIRKACEVILKCID
jgi:acetylornithine/succinyldiaminopimelate/putrescine aminotransferase